MDDNKNVIEEFNYEKKKMESGEGPKFKLIIDSGVSFYNCILYIPLNSVEAKGVYFAAAYDNAHDDNMAISMCIFFTDAIIDSKSLNYMRFDEAPGRIQISVINEKVYITDGPEAEFEELKTDKDMIIKNSDLISLNVYECAKQILNDIDKNKKIIVKNVNTTTEKYFDKYIETLNLLLRSSGNSLNNDDKIILDRNIENIKNIKKIRKKIVAFRTKNDGLISDYTNKQKQKYEKLLAEAKEAYDKFIN